MPDIGQIFAGKLVLITGAAGGLGRALVDAFQAAGARVVAATRDGSFADSTVPSVALDVSQPASVSAVAERLGAVDILVNNAGANVNGRLFDANGAASAEREMAVNYFGVLNTIRAFAPAMRERRRGAIVNSLSGLSHVNSPTMASYSASKAAAWSLTQAARAELAPFNIQVYAMFLPVMDTRMAAGLAIPKMPPGEAAAAILDHLRAGNEDGYIGGAKDLYDRLRQDPKAVERMMAARVQT